MCQFPSRGNYLRGVGPEKFLELRCVRHGRVERGHAPDRAIEILESAFRHQGRDFPCNASGTRIFVHHQQLVRLPDGGQDRVTVEKPPSANAGYVTTPPETEPPSLAETKVKPAGSVSVNEIVPVVAKPPMLRTKIL